MTEQDLLVLKASIDKVVRIVCYDGETMLAKVHLISDEDQDVIYYLVSTTRPSKYEKHSGRPAYLTKFDDIEHVGPFENS